MQNNNDNRLISWEEIQTLLHDNAEKGFIHTTYQEESQRFHYLINGDTRAIDESMRLMDPKLQGKLSDDPVRNIRYLFVINTGLATRYLIEAGIPQETVYSTSDLYITLSANNIRKTANRLNLLAVFCYKSLLT